MTAQLAPTPVFKAFDNNGFPLAFGLLTTYASGTTTKQATYVDSTQTTQNTNPIQLNFRGECALWLDPTKAYKFALTDAFGNPIPGYPVDNINAPVIPSSVNVLTFGADPTGTNDSTTAIQNALNAAGVTSVYVPSGTYKFSALTMPATFGFVLFGDGTSSVLVQTGNGIGWNTSSINYTEGYIERLAFKGTNGTNHTINTSGVGGITLQDLYFNDTPVGFSSIYCNGAVATYMHDHRLRNIQVYSTTAGHSGIRFGPLSSDSDIDGFIMNGNFAVSYCLYLDNGAETITLANAHPYNAAINILNTQGGNNYCSFNHVTFDNATQDIVSVTGLAYSTFTDCFFEAIKASKNGVTLANSTGIYFDNCRWSAAGGAGYAVNETGTSNTNIVKGGVLLPPTANFAAGMFNFIGANSYASGTIGFFPLGLNWNVVGCTQSAQAQNTTQFLGINGIQSAANLTYYVAPQNALLTTIYIATTATPAVGQTFTFTIFGGASGSTNLGSGAINNGSFTTTIALNTTVSQFDQIYIQSVFSATSGSSGVRYSLNFIA